MSLLKCGNTIFSHGIKRSLVTKSRNLMCAKTNETNTLDPCNKQFTPIYRISDSLIYLLGLNRLKTFQTATVIALIPTCLGLNVLGYLKTNELIYVSLVGFGLTAGIHAASWLLTNNLVIFVYLSEDRKTCRMSYVSYWGSRSELYCSVEDIQPIEYSKMDFFNQKIKVNGFKEPFKIISRDATIFNNAKFRFVFGNNVI